MRVKNKHENWTVLEKQQWYQFTKIISLFEIQFWQKVAYLAEVILVQRQLL